MSSSRSVGLGPFALRYGVEHFCLVPFDLAHREMRLVVISREEANEPDRHTRLILVRSIEPLAAWSVELPTLPDTCQALVHRRAQPDVGQGERDTEFFVGEYLLDHGEFAAFLYKPADHREQLDQCY